MTKKQDNRAKCDKILAKIHKLVESNPLYYSYAGWSQVQALLDQLPEEYSMAFTMPGNAQLTIH